LDSSTPKIRRHGKIKKEIATKNNSSEHAIFDDLTPSEGKVPVEAKNG
jgi:hypothetical protein